MPKLTQAVVREVIKNPPHQSDGGCSIFRPLGQGRALLQTLRWCLDVGLRPGAAHRKIAQALDPEGGDRLWEALDLGRTEVCQLEQTADQPPGRRLMTTLPVVVGRDNRRQLDAAEAFTIGPAKRRG
jgi:hypothetical protein